MFGKKTIILLIVLAVGLLAYFLFAEDVEESIGGRSGFMGLGGGGNNSVRYVNTKGVDGQNTQGQNLSEKINGKDGVNSGSQNSTNINNNSSLIKQDGSGSNSSNYNYTLEGDENSNNSSSKNTTFKIDTGKQTLDGKNNDMGNGNSGGQGGGINFSRRLANKPLSENDIRNTDIFKECMKIVEPLLSGSYNVSQIKNALLNIVGFNLLTTAQQMGFANDIFNKKYGNNAEKYCMDITRAIADVFGELEIFKECLEIVGPLLKQTSLDVSQIKVALLGLTGFALLKKEVQDKFIQQIYKKEFGEDPTVYCLNIVRAILDAMQDLALYKLCMKIVEPLIKSNPSATEVRTALLKLPGFTMVTVEDQQKFINDIVTKKYGDNPNRYCVDIVSAILEALDPAKLYENCLIALKEVVKEREVLNGAVVPEETILLKLSLMGIFNGLNTFEERKQVAKTFFGAEYTNIIKDIQMLTAQNYDIEAKKICVKIVDLILNSILGDNVFAQCMQALEEAKANKLQQPLLSTILTSFSKLTPADQNKLENMFRSFLQTGQPPAEEICMAYAESVFQNSSNGSGNNGSGNNGLTKNSKENDTLGDDGILDESAKEELSDNLPDIGEETITACMTLVRNIQQEYIQYSSTSFADPVQTLISKIPAYEFYIPGEMYSDIIDKTFIAYLSLPRTDSNGKKIHRDDGSKLMTYENQSYFTYLSTHEKGQIAKRLFDINRLVNSSPKYATTIRNDAIQDEVNPYICKNAHPDCDDAEWNNSVSMYLDYKSNANASYSIPSGIFEKAQFLNSNPFYNKCLNNSALTLTSADDTLLKIREKVEANLPEIKSSMPTGGGYFLNSTPAGQMSGLQLSDQEFSAFQCYVEKCTGGGQCSIVCKNEIANFCGNVATKYLSKTPDVSKSANPEQIFSCPKSKDSEYNLLKLHCLEVAERYSSNEGYRSQLQMSCTNGLQRLFTKVQGSAASMTANAIESELSCLKCQPLDRMEISVPENQAFISLSPEQKKDFITTLYGKVINGNIKYEQTVEQSCYDADNETLNKQKIHLTHGFQYFITDATSVRSNIVSRLWADHVTKIAASNRPITPKECLQVAADEWKKFISSPLLSEQKQSKLTLPPSQRCKCYLDSIYSILHERITKDDQDCATLANQVNDIATIVVTQSENSASKSPSMIGKSLLTIPRYKLMESTDQSTIRIEIENDLKTNRESARAEMLDRQIFLTQAQRTKHCNTIDGKLGFTSTEFTACISVLTKINYELSMQKTVKSNNVLCTIVANTVKDFATDTGQVNVFSTADTQYNDIRQSTCTQKLRAIYLQIYGLKQTFWEGGENWTFKPTTPEEARPKCEMVPDEYGNINYDAFVEE